MEQVITVQSSNTLPKPLPVPSAHPAMDPGQGVRAFYGILKFTPLLWLTGVLPFCTPLIMCWVFLRDRCWKHLKDPAIAGWFAIGGIQAFCTFVSWANTTEGVSDYIYRCFSAPISGWIFLGMLFAIGKEVGFGIKRFLGAIELTGVYYLCLGIPLMAVGMIFGIDELSWLTPIGHFIPPSLPSARFGFTAQLLFSDVLAGATVPRLVLFYPWPTCFGFAAAAVLFICLANKRSKINTFGILGSVFGMLASGSRAAIVGAVVGLCVFGFLRFSRKKRPFVLLACVTAILSCLFVPVVFQRDPLAFIDATRNSVTNLREGSSSGRQDLYDETYRQFQQKPLLGHGWQGDILEDYIPLNLGSHSTIFGLLYTGGIVTLVPFLLASLLVAVRLLRNAITGGKAAQAALGIYVVLIAMCYGECIYAFAIPVFFAFLWIGAALQDPAFQRGSAAPQST